MPGLMTNSLYVIKSSYARSLIQVTLVGATSSTEIRTKCLFDLWARLQTGPGLHSKG